MDNIHRLLSKNNISLDAFAVILVIFVYYKLNRSILVTGLAHML